MPVSLGEILFPLPVSIEPGITALDLKLILTRKGYTPLEGIGKGLEDWRKGLGLR
jgi:hypothetical protein